MPNSETYNPSPSETDNSPDDISEIKYKRETEIFLQESLINRVGSRKSIEDKLSEKGLRQWEKTLDSTIKIVNTTILDSDYITDVFYSSKSFLLYQKIQERKTITQKENLSHLYEPSMKE